MFFVPQKRFRLSHQGPDNNWPQSPVGLIIEHFAAQFIDPHTKPHEKLISSTVCIRCDYYCWCNVLAFLGSTLTNRVHSAACCIRECTNTVLLDYGAAGRWRGRLPGDWTWCANTLRLQCLKTAWTPPVHLQRERKRNTLCEVIIEQLMANISFSGKKYRSLQHFEFSASGAQGRLSIRVNGTAAQYQRSNQCISPTQRK